MRWLLKILDHFYKNVYVCCVWIGCFLFAVAVVAFSAQFIGDNISGRILNSKSIVVSVVYDKDAYNTNSLDNWLKNVEYNNNLKDLKVKFKKTDISHFEKKNSKFEIVISKNQEFMDKMSNERKFAILDENIFTTHVKPFVEFSAYHEYASVEMKGNEKMYIAYASDLKTSQVAKILKTFSAFNNSVFKASGFGTEL